MEPVTPKRPASAALPDTPPSKRHSRSPPPVASGTSVRLSYSPSPHPSQMHAFKLRKLQRAKNEILIHTKRLEQVVAQKELEFHDALHLLQKMETVPYDASATQVETQKNIVAKMKGDLKFEQLALDMAKLEAENDLLALEDEYEHYVISDTPQKTEQDLLHGAAYSAHGGPDDTKYEHPSQHVHNLLLQKRGGTYVAAHESASDAHIKAEAVALATDERGIGHSLKSELSFEDDGTSGQQDLIGSHAQAKANAAPAPVSTHIETRRGSEAAVEHDLKAGQQGLGQHDPLWQHLAQQDIGKQNIYRQELHQQDLGQSAISRHDLDEEGPRLQDFIQHDFDQQDPIQQDPQQSLGRSNLDQYEAPTTVAQYTIERGTVPGLGLGQGDILVQQDIGEPCPQNVGHSLGNPARASIRDVRLPVLEEQCVTDVIDHTVSKSIVRMEDPAYTDPAANAPFEHSASPSRPNVESLHTAIGIADGRSDDGSSRSTYLSAASSTQQDLHVQRFLDLYTKLVALARARTPPSVLSMPKEVAWGNAQDLCRVVDSYHDPRIEVGMTGKLMGILKEWLFPGDTRNVIDTSQVAGGPRQQFGDAKWDVDQLRVPVGDHTIAGMKDVSGSGITENIGKPTNHLNTKDIVAEEEQAIAAGGADNVADKVNAEEGEVDDGNETRRKSQDNANSDHLGKDKSTAVDTDQQLIDPLHDASTSGLPGSDFNAETNTILQTSTEFLAAVGATKHSELEPLKALASLLSGRPIVRNIRWNEKFRARGKAKFYVPDLQYLNTSDKDIKRKVIADALTLVVYQMHLRGWTRSPCRNGCGTAVTDRFAECIVYGGIRNGVCTNDAIRQGKYEATCTWGIEYALENAVCAPQTQVDDTLLLQSDHFDQIHLGRRARLDSAAGCYEVISQLHLMARKVYDHCSNSLNDGIFMPVADETGKVFIPMTATVRGISPAANTEPVLVPGTDAGSADDATQNPTAVEKNGTEEEVQQETSAQ